MSTGHFSLHNSRIQKYRKKWSYWIILDIQDVIYMFSTTDKKKFF